MSDYTKLSVSAIYSENQNLSDPEIEAVFEPLEKSTCTKYKRLKMNAALDPLSTDISLIDFTTINCVVIKNLDASNYITVLHKSSAGSATTQSTKLEAGKILVLPDVTVAFSINMKANTAACAFEFYADGT